MTQAEFMELPKDANGTPIKVGDVLMKLFNGRHTGITVRCLGVGIGSVFVQYGEEHGEYGIVSYECSSSLFVTCTVSKVDE